MPRTKASGIDERRKEFAAACLSYARDHERQAYGLRKLAAKVENPPEGVEVFVGGNHVSFVGPPVVFAGQEHYSE